MRLRVGSLLLTFIATLTGCGAEPPTPPKRTFAPTEDGSDANGESGDATPENSQTNGDTSSTPTPNPDQDPTTTPSTPKPPPSAFKNGAFTAKNQDVAMALVAIQAGAENETITWSVGLQPDHGNVSISNGQAVYSPKKDFEGKDTFRMKATNSVGGSTEAVFTVVVNGKALLIADKDINALQDTAMQTLLTNMGFQVTTLDDDFASLQDAAGKDLILISESVQSVKVQAKYQTVSAPVLIWDGLVSRYMALIGQGSVLAVDGQVEMDVLSVAHPALAGFPKRLTFTNAATAYFYYSPNAAATNLLSTIGDDKKPTLFIYEKGARDINGVTIPGLRVGLPFVDFSAVTPQGQMLFQAAIQYAASGL